MDQFIVTEAGETPPDLTSEIFPTLGITKTSNRKAFAKKIAELDFSPGPTFTFAFWSISQFADMINWKAPRRGFTPELRFDDISIHAPCYVSCYSLKPRQEWDRSSIQSKGDA